MRWEDILNLIMLQKLAPNLTHWLSEVKHLIQQASSLRHSESYTLYTLLIAGLTLRKMLGPAAGVLEALLSWGSSLFGSRSDPKGVLVFVFRGTAVCHTAQLVRKEKSLAFSF